MTSEFELELSVQLRLLFADVFDPNIKNCLGGAKSENFIC